MNRTTTARRDYPFIELWGRRMGSLRHYIDAQISRAHETNAPADATFERYNEQGPTGEWATMAQLADSNPPLHATLAAQAEREGGTR